MAKLKRNSFITYNTILLILCFVGVFWYVFSDYQPHFMTNIRYHEVERNYGKDIDLYASLENLPAAYFKALAILECSGKKNFPKRFEPHVYERLKNVKNGARTAYEHVTADMLQHSNDEAIRNLATSWGPFQIMGYKCLEMKIEIADLRGEDAVYWGVKWVSKTYGKLLREGRFQDAFHYHNTGKLYPKNNKPLTYHPNYVENGLKYLAHFQ